MYSVEWFRDKKVTVMGLGLHGGGVGIAKWLMRHGAAVTVTDLKGPEELADSVAELDKAYQSCLEKAQGPAVHKIVYSLGSHAEKDFAAADMVIKNPAVPRENPFLSLAASRNIPIETDISIFFLLCPFPSVAITGTKGKTTTTALLADICKAHDKRTVVGGNIRISPLDALDRLLNMARRSAAPPPIVLELSSWQLESLEKHHLSPRIGVMTNIMEDHLNRYRGMDDYAKAKELMVSFQGAGDTSVLNADDARIATIGEKLTLKQGGPRIFWFSIKGGKKSEGCFLSGGQIILNIGGTKRSLMPISAVRIPGKHNLGNILAACAAAAALGIPDRTIAAAVRRFRGVPGRLEFLGVKQGVHYFNDTTATTPDAAIAAMRTLVPAERRRVILLAGGADKELRFEEWAKVVAGRVKHLVLFSGTATPKMLAALDAAGVKTPRTVVNSMVEAMRAARTEAKRPEVVLLSPGCASFGLFINEFDRGDQFVKAVKRIKA
jgi:UDP-N-acetylmuramoylalanine--D-glutamate ligase